MLPSACIFPSIGPCQCCCLAMVRVGIRDESPPSPCMEPNNLPIAYIYRHICQLVFGLTYQHLPVLVLLAPLLRMLSLGKRFQTWHELGRRVPVVPAAEMPGQTPKIKRQTKATCSIRERRNSISSQVDLDNFTEALGIFLAKQGGAWVLWRELSGKKGNRVPLKIVSSDPSNLRTVFYSQPFVLLISRWNEMKVMTENQEDRRQGQKEEKVPFDFFLHCS